MVWKLLLGRGSCGQPWANTYMQGNLSISLILETGLP